VYEGKNEPLLSPGQFARRMALHAVAGAALVAGSLVIGAVGYHRFESLPWLDSFLNAAMILSGMGPLHNPFKTDGGKWFAMFYALFAGLLFLALTAVVLAPVVHRILHRFRLDEDGDGSSS
jgi:hypothetical protein